MEAQNGAHMRFDEQAFVAGNLQLLPTSDDDDYYDIIFMSNTGTD